jgi:Flp pilus assembly protein TadG
VKRSEDTGAVAVIVAICSVLLFGLSAFAVDFGMAYNSKRDLQKAADAAALAAATELLDRAPANFGCDDIVSMYNDPTVQAAVDAVADHYAQANRTDAQRQLMQVQCSADDKRVEVTYEASGTTPTFFGGIFGHGGGYATGRRAVADLFVPSSGLGLRPYALCLDDLHKLQDALAAPGSHWVRVKYPGDASVCGTYNGNWYTTDCPLDSNNGTLDENTQYGCRSEVSIIEPGTQAQVDAACSNLDVSPAACLQSNPGNIASNVVLTQWDKLLTMPGITVPVFNQTWANWAYADLPGCNQGGNNVCYPVQAIAGVKVCAYKWANKTNIDSASDSPSGPCYGVGTDLNGITSARPRDNNNYLWLKLESVQLSGSSKPSGCGLGDDCDAGSRGTRLIE